MVAATRVVVVGVAFMLTASVRAGDLDRPPGGSTAPATQPALASQSPRAEQPATDVHAALAAGDAKEVLRLLESGNVRLHPAERASIDGRAHFLLGEYAEARRKLEAALRQRPNDAENRYWLGRVHAAAGMPALAVEKFQEANWNRLDTADLHYHWAVALKSLNELLGKVAQRAWRDDAAESPRPGALALDGLIVGDVPARPGWVLVSPPNSALYQAYRTVELEPKRGEAWRLCGEIWAALNRHEPAARAFEKAAPLLPSGDRSTCHEQWAQSLLAVGDFDGYLEQQHQRLELLGEVNSKEMARCYDVAAREVARRGDLKRQVRYLTLAAELDSSDVERLISLADALLQAQRAADASRYLKTAMEQGPSREQRKQIQQRLQATAYLAAPR
jgi:tetratricopeptide (TPR) repeat protein